MGTDVPELLKRTNLDFSTLEEQVVLLWCLRSYCCILMVLKFGGYSGGPILLAGTCLYIGSVQSPTNQVMCINGEY